MASSSSSPHAIDRDASPSFPPGCTINEVVGDLFGSADEALAHCVSENLAMGKGIAVEFKKRFGRVSELKEQACGVGQVAYLEFPAGGARDVVRPPADDAMGLKPPQTFVFYLITKKMHFHKPTYRSLEDSLRAMKDLIVRNRISTLSIPLLGCGLDKLVWKGRDPCVLSVIRNVFSDVNIRITVYTLPRSS